MRYIIILLYFVFADGGPNGQGSGRVYTKRKFDREQQKYYLMPIVMEDSGVPSTSGTNTLTIIIGDQNDNEHFPGHKTIHVYNYKGECVPADLAIVLEFDIFLN